MKKALILTAVMLLFFAESNAQVSINTDNTTPDQSAMLDIKSTTKGVVFPRMNLGQLSSITNPVNGLQVFCTTDGKMYIFVAAVGQWKELAYGSTTINPPFNCGISITINHIVGVVSPVTKTATYATVNNIQGEPEKCWITSNLGSDHQAASVNDVTESSAGWYWQFNLKQGYKHDGSVLTPSWTITNINETSDWLIANDPCNLELGSSWRIPTYTEWNNVSNTWMNWIDAWNSPLKLHGAGFLNSSFGSLNFRGVTGYYWSSTQYSSTYGWELYITNSGNLMGNYKKAYAFTVRCIRN